MSQTMPLYSNNRMPPIGLGTWEIEPYAAHDAILSALKIGYRHFDCAKFYNNQSAIGEALQYAFKTGLVTRDQLWITSKLWCNSHQPEAVLPAMQDTLQELQLTYLDLYLIHWPVSLKTFDITPNSLEMFFTPNTQPSLIDTWLAMDQLKKKMHTKHIGVSNFSEYKLIQLIEATQIIPEVNQIERHPFLQQPLLSDFCKKNKIQLTHYSPLGRNNTALIRHPIIMQLTEKYHCTPQQLLLRWGLATGSAVIPKSINEKNQLANLKAIDIPFTEEDLNLIATLDQHCRYVSGQVFDFTGSPYTLKNIWDE
ncbi:MAG: aldo/keto reductase [Endozoicomonadaceae bacterium]|nr:aldo/keto reductase [Endozoicomonadaceae bacterium]